MSDVTLVLNAAVQGDPCAAAELLPLVYDELRRLAAHRLAGERHEHTLQPTALVHEAWLRIAGTHDRSWQGRQHFFAAAAEAMRRILVENARRKRRLKHGGDWERVPLDAIDLPAPMPDDSMLALDDALTRLTEFHPAAAEVVKLCFFVGLTHDQAAEALGVSLATVERLWAFARAWLLAQMKPTGVAS
jgi:RNA polymerase sigma factor (TIGR02999 family)